MSKASCMSAHDPSTIVLANANPMNTMHSCHRSTPVSALFMLDMTLPRPTSRNTRRTTLRDRDGHGVVDVAEHVHDTGDDVVQVLGGMFDLVKE